MATVEQETRDVLDQMSALIRSHLEHPRENPLAVEVTPEEIRAHLRARYDFAAPLPPDEVLADVTRLLQRWTEHATHPLHLGLFRPTVGRAAVVADALVALFDPNLATWDFAPAANEIERHVLAVLARALGQPPDGLHHFTSGGQEANHTAVIVALTSRFPEAGRSGLRSLTGQPTFYASEESHHSFDKVALATGLGRAARRLVAAGDDLRLDVDALAARIKADRASGDLPFLVVGTAGTTNAGAIDPLPELADLAAREGLWFHVDAAWGGAAVLSPRLQQSVAGIERADSVTFDAHKWLSVPAAAGMFFCRDREAVERSFATDAAYVPPRSSDRMYPFITSLQWTRRFIGLKLFMTLAEGGLLGLIARIEHQAAMGTRLRQLLEEAGWIVVNDTPLPVVCFTHPSLNQGGRTHEGIVRWLKKRQIAWISSTRLRGRTSVLRACITNYETTPDDLATLVRALQASVAAGGD